MKSEFLKFSSKRILFSTVVTSVLMAGSPLEVFAADATEVQAVMQTGTVTGQVVDAKGEPVIGASILIKGTGTGIITDINGNFTVSASPDATLVVSFVGYKTQEISLSGKKNIKIILQEDSELLDEVVVVAYFFFLWNFAGCEWWFDAFAFYCRYFVFAFFGSRYYGNGLWIQFRTVSH